MKPNFRLQATLLIIGTMALAAGSATRDLTTSERDQAFRYLEGTRKGVVDAVQGLSNAQWNFKSAPDRWSIAEIVEHIAVTEGYIDQGVFGHFAEGPAPAPDRDPKQGDAMILAKMPDRSTKAQAPPPLVPTGRWSPASALDHFLSARAATIEILKSTPDLRGHLVNHPAFGPLDGYQWILAAAAHSERHTKQILEVKADPNFPTK